MNIFTIPATILCGRY